MNIILYIVCVCVCVCVRGYTPGRTSWVSERISEMAFLFYTLFYLEVHPPPSASLKGVMAEFFLWDVSFF